MHFWMKIFLWVALLLQSIVVFACPDQILLIRHAEKMQKGCELSPLGKLRAQALVKLFTLPNANFKRPTFVTVVTDASARPLKTCQATAQALKLAIDAHYSLEQEANGELASALLQKNGVGLVCLEHHRIPALVQGLTQNKLKFSYWGDDVFDRILILHFKEIDGQCRFISSQDISENLFASDRQHHSCTG